MNCPNCNEKIADGVKFCTKCGANIEEAKKIQEEIAKKETEKEEQEEVVKKETEIKAQEEIIGNAENKEKQEEIESKNVEENESQKPEEKPKKKKSKKGIIIALIILILLIAGAVAGVAIWKINQDNEEQENLEWGDVYLEVLNDKDELEDMDNQKIQLCDLDKDSIPELIIYGIKNTKEYIANIYKINDKNEVDTIKVSLDNEFDLKLVYDANRDDYVWYAVAKQSDNTTKVYDLNIDEEEPKSEEVTLNFGTDALEIEENYSKKVDFDKDASKSDKREIFEKAKENYVSTEDMITEEVKEEVENIKIIKNISKINSSKDIVYSVVSKKLYGGTYEYPCININSDDVKTINSEIKEKYGFSENISEKNFGDEIPDIESEEISYKYTINGSVLSLVVWDAGNESIWADTYNVDLKTCKKIEAKDLLTQYGFESDEVISKATEVVENEFDTVIEKEKKALGSTWSQMYDTEYSPTTTTDWRNDIKTSAEELHLFVNEDNELCIYVEYQHAGGQWSCTQTMVVNITKGYKISEMTFKDGTTFEDSVQTEQTEKTSSNSSTNTTTTETGSLPENAPSDAKVYNNHAYKVFKESVTWSEAKQKCEEMGGHLVTITSQEEQDFIETINSAELWIGGYRDGDTWKWVTGEEWSYTNWDSGEPNNSSNVVSNECCVTVWPKKWNDLADTNKSEQSGYICEWE